MEKYLLAPVLILLLLGNFVFQICTAFTVTSRGIQQQRNHLTYSGTTRQHFPNCHLPRLWNFSTCNTFLSFSSPSWSPNDNEEDENTGDDELPTLDDSQLKWLQERSNENRLQIQQDERRNQEEDNDAAEKLSGNVNIPKTGISINDEMLSFQNAEKFVTNILPLDKLGVGILQTVTVNAASDEPLRYLVPLRPVVDNNSTNHSDEVKKFAMIDLPPYSDDLVLRMKAFMGNNTSLSHILITCKNGIHYDEAPAVYVTRKSDMEAWKKAFPDVNIVMYRLDIPRDCKNTVSQTLDGYGPWALDYTTANGTAIFRETGRPLKVIAWNEEVQARVFDKGEMPPDDEDENLEDEEMYSPKAIKEREENKDILAIYTPGHTYGSVTYIFPQTKVCCSGCAIPVEDNIPSGYTMGLGMATGVGPRLDYSGYLTTNSGGIERQVESARHIVSVYADRFDILLPARGPPVKLSDFTAEERSGILHGMLNDFAEIGRVYSSLGIL
jgi:hypothetical protein